jgi:hypothetical protein
VNDDAYFLAVLRYMLQNPVKAGLCKSPSDYLWSSCGSIGKNSSIVEHAKVLELAAAGKAAGLSGGILQAGIPRCRERKPLERP